MTGPEHYAAAERLLGDVNKPFQSRFDGNAEMARQLLSEAQVHATLAHTAATADLFALYGQVGDESKEAWRKAVTP